MHLAIGYIHKILRILTLDTYAIYTSTVQNVTRFEYLMPVQSHDILTMIYVQLVP